MSHKLWFGSVLLSGFLGLGAAAQEAPAPAAAPPSQGPSQPAKSASHYQAARDLFETVGGTQLMVEAATQEILNQVRLNPELAPYEEVFRTWSAKVFADPRLSQGIAEIYSDLLTEEEIRGLIEFYRTPLGKKSLSAMGEATARGAELGMAIGEEYAPELDAMLQAARAEREKASSPEPPAEEEKSPSDGGGD